MEEEQLIKKKEKIAKYRQPNPQVQGPHPELPISKKATRVSNLLGFSLKTDEIAALNLELGDMCEIRIINKSKQL